MLGDIQWREDPLPGSGPTLLVSHVGLAAETGQTQQRSLLAAHVSRWSNIETRRGGKSLIGCVCPFLRYSLMLRCWAAQADARPAFKDVVQILSGYTETLAGYLDMNSNPFIPGPEVADNLAPPNRLSALYYNIAAKLTGKSPATRRRSPRSSPHASPSITPCLSPRVSPKGTPRATPRVSPEPDPVVKTYNLPPSITIELDD